MPTRPDIYSYHCECQQGRIHGYQSHVRVGRSGDVVGRYNAKNNSEKASLCGPPTNAWMDYRGTDGQSGLKSRVQANEKHSHFV